MELRLRFILLSILSLILSLIFYHAQLQANEKVADYTKCKENIKSINDLDDSDLVLYSDQLIYFYSKNTIEPLDDNLLTDNDFHIRFHKNVLRYARKVEYCQWIEHVHGQTDSTNRVRNVTYSYVQSWHPYLISSLFYNESSSYVNPQRDPYSSKTVTLPQGRKGRFVFNGNLIEQLKNFKDIKDDNDMFIKSTDEYAEAYNEHQFEYIGNGYFYSQYEKVILNTRSSMNEIPSKAKITKYLQQRHSVGFSRRDECVAGDILIQFSIVKPDSISVIAKAVPYANGLFILDPYKTDHNYNLYFIYDGEVSVDDVLRSVSLQYISCYCLFCLFSVVCFIFLILAFVPLCFSELDI